MRHEDTDTAGTQHGLRVAEGQPHVNRQTPQSRMTQVQRSISTSYSHSE